MSRAASASATTSWADATGSSDSSGCAVVCSASIFASSASGGYPSESFIVKRSSCASGSGYVPSYSIGFCVAMTMNGRASSYVPPSIVPCRSCMHSSSADCVFGDARLISSTSTRFANTGPGRNSNSFARWLNTFTPVTSVGRRSGVNWIREKAQSSERARAFVNIVFPTPGKSSMIRWPSATRHRTTRRSVSSGACTTRPRFSTTRAIVCAGATSARCDGLSASSTQQFLHLVQHHSCDLLFPRLFDLPLHVRRHEYDLVLRRVEADVASRYVVEDEEVRALALQLLARAGEARLAVVGREAADHLAIVAV